MLQQEAVVDGKMGSVLAEFLVEFLPFEEEASNQIRSVSLVLQGGLINTAEQLRLWEKGKHKNAYYVGFLQTLPDNLPGQQDPNPAWESTCQRLAGLTKDGNPLAIQLCRLLGPAGQSFLAGVEMVLKKPSNQDVMVDLLHAMAAYSAALPHAAQQRADIGEISRMADKLVGGTGVEGDDMERFLKPLVQSLPDSKHHIRAMLFLAMLDEPVLNPVFSRTDAIGTVMRKKLMPVTVPIQEQIVILKEH